VIIDAACAAYDNGLCTIPPATDGSKRPGLKEWKQYQTERPSIDQVLAWFGDGAQGLGLVCGAVSGGLEMLEFEGVAVHDGLYTEFVRAASSVGLGELVDRIRHGYEEETPRHGVHWLWRCDEVDGNLKLARRPGPEMNTIDVLIETRGEGGFTIIAPSAGTTHPNGGSWVLSAGGFDTIATITPDERAELLRIARSLDRMPPREVSTAVENVGSPNGDRPGDAFNADASWDDVLTGWTAVYERDGTIYWRRPGKDHGISATTNHTGTDHLKVFSSSTLFDTEQTYDKFGAYAVLEHGGDFSAAARAIGPAPQRQTPPQNGLEADVEGGDPGQHGNHHDEADTAAVAPDGYRLTDAGNARRLVDLCPGCFRYAHAWGRWIVYGPGVWAIDANDALITEWAKGVARGLFRLAAEPELHKEEREKVFTAAIRAESSGAIAAMVKLARGIPGVIVEHEQLDANPYILNVLNGTIDLRTGELRPHDPADLCTKQAGVVYDPDAKAPLWEQCLDTWQPDPEMRDYLQLEAGAAATGKHTETVSVHHGVGNNGKSKFWGAIGGGLGDYTTVPHKSLLVTQRHEQHETIKADLFRARLAIAAETKAADVLDDEQVKSITGGDRQRARRMREDPWFFDPSHTLVMFSNHRPRVQGQDEGIWRRLRLVPWTVVIPEHERDRELADKLRGETSGILNWIIAGAVRFLAHGFDPPDTVTAATNRYRQEEDTVGRFITDSLTLGDDQRCSTADIVEELERWAKDNGVDQPAMNDIATRLHAAGCTNKRQSVAGRRQTRWTGVSIGGTSDG
jgi:putative DNA primase/helicase